MSSLSDLDLRVRKIHSALDEITEPDFSRVIPELKSDGASFYAGVDFSNGFSEANLSNTASSVVASIASLKDYLDKWCLANGKPRSPTHKFHPDTD